MSEYRSGRAISFQRLWQFVKRQIVDDTPEDLALCEFDCRKGQCLQDEWETCGRRILKGAGELFPDARLGGFDPGKPGRTDEPENIPDRAPETAKGKVTIE
jgi:hypothetical protein